MNEITRPMALDETLQDVAASLKVLAATASPANAKVYGMRIKYDTESDPASIVKYLGDAIGLTPAHMDYTNNVFDYGDMEDLWFVRDCKPCILGQNGVVQAYLNPNDYTKDIYGNTVTIDETLTGANVMIEFPKIWMKIVPFGDDNSMADVYFSQVKVDDGYKDYPYIDYQGVHKEHFYMPAYNGSLINDGTNDVLRSVSGQAVMNSKTGTQEISYAKANGDGWYTELFGQIQLINMLLLFMGKSTDTQTVFGRGIDTGAQTAFNAYVTGAGNIKGLFWGSNDGTQLVKVFGIENWWGLQWRRYGGHIIVSGSHRVKLCYGREDGSTTDNFNTDASGYITLGAAAPSGTSGGYISKMYFSPLCMMPTVASGSSSTYFADGLWFNNSATTYAYWGGSPGYGLRCGAFFLNCGNAVGLADWNVGAALSYV